MHIHFHIETEVVERISTNVKHVYRICRCGNRKLAQVITSHDKRFWRTEADRSEW